MLLEPTVNVVPAGVLAEVEALDLARGGESAWSTSMDRFARSISPPHRRCWGVRLRTWHGSCIRASCAACECCTIDVKRHILFLWHENALQAGHSERATTRRPVPVTRVTRHHNGVVGSVWREFARAVCQKVPVHRRLLLRRVPTARASAQRDCCSHRLTGGSMADCIQPNTRSVSLRWFNDENSEGRAG